MHNHNYIHINDAFTAQRKKELKAKKQKTHQKIVSLVTDQKN